MNPPDDPYLAALDRIGKIAQENRANPRQAMVQVLQVAIGMRTGAVLAQILQTVGPVVQTGPFAGMKYHSRAPLPGLLITKLLGCYESELHDVVKEITGRPYQQIVNVGCGEGYYAVGLARLFPQLQVHAFDGDAIARQLCGMLARLNGVADRVRIGGLCDVHQLRELARPGTLLVVDCEGGELELLDPVQVPGLAGCDILVELHDCFKPGTSAAIAARFERTHDVQLIPQAGRNPNAYPCMRGLHQFDQQVSVCEHRPGPTPWAFMKHR